MARVRNGIGGPTKTSARLPAPHGDEDIRPINRAIAGVHVRRIRLSISIHGAMRRDFNLNRLGHEQLDSRPT